MYIIQYSDGRSHLIKPSIRSTFIIHINGQKYPLVHKPQYWHGALEAISILRVGGVLSRQIKLKSLLLAK